MHNSAFSRSIKALVAVGFAVLFTACGSSSKEDVEDSGAEVEAARRSGLFRWPLASVQVTSEFGQRWGRLHAGLDLAANQTPVLAAASGTVAYAGPASGYGNLSELNHGNGWSTRYGHLSGFYKSQGKAVRQGELIARSGNTGRSTGPHLHFETRRNGTPINPRTVLR